MNIRSILLADTNLTQKLAYVAGTNKIEYVGYAHPVNADPGKLVWKIKLITYDGDKITDIQWAKTNATATDHMKFTKEWDERTGYTYE